MRILFTVEFYEPHKGGAEEVVRQLAERLVIKGHDVTIATSFLGKRKSSILNGVKIESFRISGNLVNKIKGEKEEIKRYRDFLSSGFDIVLNYAAQIWTTDLAFEILDSIKAKKVLVPCGYSGLRNSLYNDYFQKLPNYLKKYDKLIYMSPNYQDKVFGDINGVGDKAVIIPNGASEKEFLSDDNFKLKEKFKISTKYLAISVSNHYKAKGHAFVIDAFRKMKNQDITLLVIGEIPSSGIKKTFHFLRGCYKDCFLKSIVWKNIRVLNGRDRDVIVLAYKKADLFLFGSEVECAPLVMYESFASKTVFITRDVGNVSDYRKYIKIVSSSGEMANIADYLLEDKNKRNLLIENAFNLWKENFTWEKIVEKYESLFLSL